MRVEPRLEGDGIRAREDDVTLRQSPRQPLRIAVGADELLVGQALRAALAARGLVTRTIEWRASVPDDPPALQLSRLRPDVGLMLCRDELSPALAQVLWLFAQHPVRWVVVVSPAPGPVGGALLEGGAGWVMSAGASLDAVVDRLADVAAGECVQSPADAGDLLASWEGLPRERRDILARMRTMTPREVAVLELLSAGRSVRAIAGTWDVSEATVRSQVKSVLHKLEVDSQLRAVAAVRVLCGELP